MIKFKFVDIGVVAELARVGAIGGGYDGVRLVIKHYLMCW